MSSIITRELGVLALLSCIYSAVPSESITSAKPAIQRVASLHTPRSAHTATTLRSGQVLIVGGMTSGGSALSSVELFDPGTNSSQELSDLSERRTGHTATLLADGRVLIAGGYDGEYLASLEVFDPATRRFGPAGSLMVARSGQTATLLPDGRVLFVGGVGTGWTFLASAEIYDPSLGKSKLVGSMRAARESHTATMLPDGRVLIVGGHSGRRPNQVAYSSAEVFSPNTRRFSPVGDLATPRHKHDATALPDGRVLVIGGADRTDRVHFATTEIYDPRAATFVPGPAMKNPRYKIAGTSVLLPTGDVLVTSGARSAEVLRRGSSAFTEIHSQFPDAYRFAAAALLPGGDVVISGGYSDANENASGVWRFRSAALMSAALLPEHR